MEALSNTRPSIVRIPRPQLELAARQLAWKSFRARLAQFVRRARRRAPGMPRDPEARGEERVTLSENRGADRRQREARAALQRRSPLEGWARVGDNPPARSSGDDQSTVC